MIDLRVLIIEDDEFLLKKIGKVLSREISNIYTFKNPIEVLNNIETIKPDIIISDINMPEMTGIDMYKKLKQLNLNIPIILASAFSEPEYFIEAIKLKVKKFILKPIDLDELLEELKQFEKEIIDTRETTKRERMLIIQSKMAAMGEMLANIAHQWKQPLNTISICSSNLKVEKEFGTITDKNNIIDEMVGNILNSVNYMSSTITDFQNYLKPNKLESCFFIKDTIDKVEKLIYSQCLVHNIKIIKNIDDSNLCSYQNELIQILINIEKNAIDELANLDQEDKVIKIESKTNGNDITITIHDNAGGIPDSLLNKIFKSYFTTKKEFGTGIGLYMSRQIAENHLNGKLTVSNEEIEVNNKKYMGAKFIIKIPSLKSLDPIL